MIATDRQKIKMSSVFSDWLARKKEEIDLRKKQQQEMHITTSLPIVDAKLSGGFRKENLIVLGGLPGTGKTTFSLQFALHRAQQNDNVLLYNCEMSPDTLMQKMIANFFHIRMSDLDAMIDETYEYLRSKIKSAEGSKFANAVSRISYSSMPASVDTVKRDIEEDNANIVIVDYLQRLQSLDCRRKYIPDPRMLISMNIDILKNLAVQYKNLVMCISSLNRESAKNGVTIASFMESSAIEYTADVAMALCTATKNKKGEYTEATNGDIHEARADGTNLTVLLKLLKVRHFQEGNALLNFYRSYQKFGHYKTESGQDE
jgi:replicative DNA helicase